MKRTVSKLQKCKLLSCKMLRLLRFIPAICIASLIFWSTYVFLVDFAFGFMRIEWALVSVGMYALLFGMTMWSFFKTTFTRPVPIGKEYRLSSDDLSAFQNCANDAEKSEFLKFFVFERRLFLKTFDKSLTVPRFCNYCCLVKPDRAHHCSICDDCILKHDHHCPWVSNCIGFHNYKFFYLFLGYAWLYCLFLACLVGPVFLPSFFQTDQTLANFKIFFVFILALIFCLCLTILFGFHVYLAGSNKTTVENAYRPHFSRPYSRHGFHLGFVSNMREVFGKRPFFWFLPVHSSLGDGMRFTTRDEIERRHELPQSGAEPTVERERVQLLADIESSA